MKIGMFFQEITSITEFPGSNVLLTLFLTGGKLDFKVANLLLLSTLLLPFIPLCKHLVPAKQVNF